MYLKAHCGSPLANGIRFYCESNGSVGSSADSTASTRSRTSLFSILMMPLETVAVRLLPSGSVNSRSPGTIAAVMGQYAVTALRNRDDKGAAFADV